jgi:hypothetical protein
MRNTAMVNGRITAEQMEWLQARADELGGNLSAALRQTITDARILEMMREDYRLLRKEHPEFTIPPDEDGMSRVLSVMLSLKLGDSEDMELRREEAEGEG